MNLIIPLVFLFFLFAGSSRIAFAQIIKPIRIKRELPPTPPTKPEPPLVPTPPTPPECPDACGPCHTPTPTPTGEPTPTPFVTPTPTSVLTPTPTPAENRETSDGETSEVTGTGGTPEVQGRVLGAQTLGATGSFEENFFGLLLTAGFIIASMGVRKLGKKSFR